MCRCWNIKTRLHFRHMATRSRCRVPKRSSDGFVLLFCGLHSSPAGGGNAPTVVCQPTKYFIEEEKDAEEEAAAACLQVRSREQNATLDLTRRQRKWTQNTGEKRNKPRNHQVTTRRGATRQA